MNETLAHFLVDMYDCAVLFLTTTYIYFKTSALTIHQRYKSVLTISAGCLFISLAFASLYLLNGSIAQIMSYIFPSFFFILFERKQIRIKFLVCFLASSFTRVIQMFIFLLYSIIFSAANLPKGLLALIPAYATVFLAAVLFLKIKKYKKGFLFFQDENKLGCGLVFAGIIFLLMGFVYTQRFQQQTPVMVYVALFGLFISGFGLYLWLRRSIDAHYRERLQLKSEEHFQALLDEKEQENQRLTKTNEYLAKVVHSDNHLMSALNASVHAYFACDNPQCKDSLLREIQTLVKERSELTEREQRHAKTLPETGNLLTDGAINDLYIKAAAHGIDFSLTVSETVDAVIGKFISQTDLQTLLCDHIEDAIIAVEAKKNHKGKILVDLSAKNGSYQITVFDNGVDFEADTLAKLGKERVTTHADNGGSGIGFMTTFETLRKAYASLIITEFESKTPFSKSVAVRFDGRCAFIVQSYRAEYLREAIRRDDVEVRPC